MTMGLTNQYERDLMKANGIHKTGRIDMRLLQNTSNAGDGFPGVQKAIRNWVEDFATKIIQEKIYIVATDEEFDDAISDIEANAPCAGRIILLNSINGVQVTINNANCSYVIEGHGNQVVLTPSGENAIITVTACTSCLIQNLKMDFTGFASTGSYCIQLAEASNNRITLDNLYLIGDGTNGQGVAVHCDNCLISNCYIEDGRYGIYILNSNNIKIINSEINGCLLSGIRLDGVGADNNHILGNTITQCQDGINMDHASYNVIKGNYLYNNSEGIDLDDECDNNLIDGNILNANGIYFQYTSRYNIVSNNILNSGSITIDCQSVADNSYYNVISGNRIINGQIEFFGNGGQCYFNVITNNMVEGALTYCISLRDGCHYNVISGNIAYNGSYAGIRLSDDCSYNTISGNNCSECDVSHTSNWGGIVIDNNSDRNSITGNSCHGNNNSGSGSSYGILINSSDCDENSVVGNNCSGNDGEFSDSGTNTFYQTATDGDPLNNF